MKGLSESSVTAISNTRRSVPRHTSFLQRHRLYKQLLRLERFAYNAYFIILVKCDLNHRYCRLCVSGPDRAIGLMCVSVCSSNNFLTQ